MKSATIALLAAALACAAPALAQTEPPRAPVPAWVDVQPLPSPDPKLADKPLQLLLFQSDSRFGPGQPEQYIETATLIQNTQGLAAAGTISIPWSPTASELIVNKLQIVRGDKRIDVLANQHFTVLRRESNLEKAVLDGTLTAVIQPDGLSVGDVVEIGLTLRQKPGALAFAPEELLIVGADVPVRHVRMRNIWPKDAAIRWNASATLGRPKVRVVGGNTEVTVDLTDVKFETPPGDLPARMRVPAWLQVTGYGSWADISRLAAPAFAKAATLAPGSPIKAEIAKIAAASADPRQRAAAALRLVEDQVRYVAVAIGDAGYIPAAADETWTRKYGDCKGKTVLLLAMLKGLGIDAEPALVSTAWSDALPARLPQVRPFDHVLVRARIGGKTYWLDGTRRGDSDLEDLVVPPFASALPLTLAGSDLVTTDVGAPPRPLTETNLVYDASKGFSAPVHVMEEQIFRGDPAILMRVGLAEMGLEQFKKRLLDSPPTELGAAPKVEVVPDDGHGGLLVRYEGTAKMDWGEEGQTRPLRFRFDNETISWTPDFKRSEGPYKEAPVALHFPVSLAATETVILPQQGKGFTLDARPIERTVGGTRITRTVTIENGRAVARSTFVRLKREIDAGEARASIAPLQEISGDKAYLVAPEGLHLAEAEAKPAAATDPKDAEGLLERGFRRMQAGNDGGAIEDFTRAIALSPKWARPLADRGIAYFHEGKIDLAQADLARAATLNDKDFVVHQGMGLLALRREKLDEAVKAFSRSLELDPDNGDDLGWRARAYQRMGKLPDALADIDAVLKRKPEDGATLMRRVELLAAMDRELDTLRALDKVQAADADSGYLAYRAQLLKRFGHAEEAKLTLSLALFDADRRIAAATTDEARVSLRQGRAEILAEMGRSAEAVRELDALIAAHPGDSDLLNARCWTRATANLDLPLALADCEAAVKAEAKSAQILDSRAFVKLRLGRFAEAVADYNAALALDPDLAASHYGRGLAKLRLGRRDAGNADLAAARRYERNIDTRFAEYGLKP